ncbi:SGNH/GDSL hydrolase family protein [Urechidicola croceus]|uniref:Carbohydrate esterase 2 N-terminal domain-containing protein n=1 Tax=Urechidicola croceus TaxID=1850246 RepID=A0A1D8PAU3_9FLAO|nr:SGNH/GDSL hydrolase family protein [Urechidicola croceus]AOW21699.1 hypothetical protein LPB138_13860 [Urechidicola croceus]
MNTILKLTSTLLLLILITSCKENSTVEKIDVANENLTYKGRVEKLENSVILIGSASSITTKIIGNTCEVYLKNNANQNNYVSIEVDGKYLKKLFVEKDTLKAYKIELNPTKTEQTVSIYKATEASTGDIVFGGFNAESVKKVKNTSIVKIEFIGDSITCAAASDTSIPCGGDSQYYDQSNAYFSYATILGRELNADVLLSSVSGIGIYRNWNSVKGEEPIMPEVYENLYLNKNTSKPYNFKSFTPDIVSICLGTNDFSNGDGVKERLPFDQNAYVEAYIDFLKVIISKYPQAKIALLDSPMVTGENNVIFNKCLNRIKEYFKTENPEKSISIFKFDNVVPTGCGFHPEIKEHKEMARMLMPFFKNL